MKSYLTMLMFAAATIGARAEDNDVSVSTTQLIEVAWKKSGNESAPGSGTKLLPKKSYATIQVVGCHANITSKWWKKVFSTNTRSFASVKVKGEFGNRAVEALCVGPAKKAAGGDANLDMGFSPVIADRVPWLYDSMELDLRVSKAADSTIDSLVDGISAVTSSVPDLTISTSVTAATSVAKVIDKLLFAPGRSVSPLHAKLQLKTNSEQFTEGIYVVLASDDPKDYAAYTKDDPKVKLKWDGKNLLHGDAIVQNISFFVVQVSVHQTLFDKPEDAINSTKPWAQKFSQAVQLMPEIKDPSDDAELAANIAVVRARFVEGRTLLDLDTNVLNSEKNTILSAIRKQTIAVINSLSESEKDKSPALVSKLRNAGISKMLSDNVASSMMKEGRHALGSGTDRSLYFRLLRDAATNELKPFVDIQDNAGQPGGAY